MKPLLSLLLLIPLLLGADRPADSLLALAPPDASMTLAVENLQPQRQAFLASPIGQALQDLPAYRHWRKSPGFQKFAHARTQIERALGTDLASAADDLLGDAVVLVLRVEPDDQGARDPHGLLLLKFRHEPTLTRLIAAINDADRRSGTLQSLETRHLADHSYTVRHFAANTKPDESYAILPGRIFVWSNSESLVTGALGRIEHPRGLLANSDFALVRAQRPEQALATLYLSGDFLRLIPPDTPDDPSDWGQTLTLSALKTYLQSERYAGLALSLTPDVRLDALEHRDPSSARPTSEPPPLDPLLSRVPPDAVLVAAARFDPNRLVHALLDLLDPPARRQADHLLETLSGFTLGRSLPNEILPALGPRSVAYLAPAPDPETSLRPTLLAALEFQGGDPIAQALANAVRSVFTLSALDPKNASRTLRLGSIPEGDPPLTTLSGPKSTLVSGASSSLLALGNNAPAVRAFLAPPNPSAPVKPSMALRDRAARFPDADLFLHLDLQAAHALAIRIQPWLVRTLAANRNGDETSARQDLEQLLGLIHLFRAAYLTRTASPDRASIRSALVLVPRDDL